MEPGEINRKRQWPPWLNAALLMFANWAAVTALSLQVRSDAEVVAVAFPPWWNTRQVFLAAASANASIVRMTAVPALLVVRPDGNDGLTRLRNAGALLMIDPQAVAACFSTNGDQNDVRGR
jgi:hypothetical protein